MAWAPDATPAQSGDPAGVAAHHLDDDDPAVRRRRREQPVDALGGEADARCRSRTSRSSSRGRCRSSSARRRRRRPASWRWLAIVSEPSPPTVIEGVDAVRGEQADQLVGAVDLGPRAVGLLHRVGRRVAPVRRADDRAALVDDAAHRLAGQRDDAALRVRSGLSRPLKPSRMPTTSQPRLRAANVAARMTALRPGASPPPVLMAMRLMSTVTAGHATVRDARGRRVSRATSCVESVDGLDHGVEAAAAEDAHPRGGRSPARCRAAGRPWRSSGGPGSPTARCRPRRSRGALVLRRERHAGQVVAAATDDHDRPVLAERRVVLERHPRPHDLARIGIAVELGRVLDAHARPRPAGSVGSVRASSARRWARRC